MRFCLPETQGIRKGSHFRYISAEQTLTETRQGNIFYHDTFPQTLCSRKPMCSVFMWVTLW